jgi:cyclin-dependent kinase 8/11
MEPANIFLMGEGPEQRRVKLSDLGFAEIFHLPLRPLVDPDPAAITFLLCSPELLTGARHYPQTTERWVTECVFAQLPMSAFIIMTMSNL